VIHSNFAANTVVVFPWLSAPECLGSVGIFTPQIVRHWQLVANILEKGA